MSMRLEIGKEERDFDSFFSGKFIGYNIKAKNRGLRCIKYLLNQGLIDKVYVGMMPIGCTESAEEIEEMLG